MMKDHYPFSQFVGVDVSKRKLDISFDESKQALTIDNAQEQIVTELIQTFENPESTIVVMEATGGYENLLVTLLHRHNIAVAVVNPRRIRDFATGIGKDAKTDPIDAQVIASSRPRKWPSPRKTRGSMLW